MQVKGVLHITPFKNRVADCIWVVKTSEGVEGCAKMSPVVSSLLSTVTSPGQILHRQNLGFSFTSILQISIF